VNTRDLRTLAVDTARLASLAPALPAAHCVAESGLRVSEDAARVSAMGYKLALVGTALMRSDDPSALIASMREAGA
jgi:indole-3-glycerol phosphate synthase